LNSELLAPATGHLDQVSLLSKNAPMSATPNQLSGSDSLCQGSAPLKVLVCVPTYNEAENIEPFLNAVFAAAPPDTEVLVIDDNSPDGTAAIVEGLIARCGARLSLIKRPGKQGGATAFLTAFEWGLAKGFDAMLAMDADFSHDVKYIPGIIEKAAEADVVIGSRLVKGGAIENRSWTRNLLSRGASLYCRQILGCPLKDWTGGYNLWTKNALRKIGIAGIVTRGYSFQIELKYKAFLQKCRIVETPVVFPDRKAGLSKMPKSFLIKALLDVWRVKFMCVRSAALKEFFKFGITGGLGTITNLALFFFCADVFKLPPVPVSIGCFIIAGTQNYLLNHLWSFARNMRGTTISLARWLLFLCASLAGLAVNIAVMTTVLRYANPPYKFIAQACGIAVAIFINFATSKFFVFRRKK
jgi:dolichol-phosphate mannosyltransferase